jgi:transcriptional regulator with XRE-family HTH domain
VCRGFDAGGVQKWERGGVPDAALLAVVADYFGVSIDALYGWKPGDCGTIRPFAAKP